MYENSIQKINFVTILLIRNIIYDTRVRVKRKIYFIFNHGILLRTYVEREIFLRILRILILRNEQKYFRERKIYIIS